MDKIVTLLDLQKQARDAVTIDDLGFLIANKTHSLIPYKQSIFWLCDGGAITLKTLSGMAKMDVHGPYAVWLKRIIKDNIGNDNAQIYFPATSDGEWNAKHNYLQIFKTKNEGALGGVWIETDKKLSDDQAHLLADLCECYTQSLALLKVRQSKTRVFDFGMISKYKKIAMIVALVAFFMPMRLTVTAPAEIVAANPVVITMPYDGVLDDISVKPGDGVAQGQIIATLDKSAIETEMAKAEQALKMAQATLSRAGVESLRSEDKKSDLQALRAEIATKRIDYNYARDRLDKTDITSPSQGIAVFSDSSSLEGKAHATGEKIMMIAAPDDIELLVRVPAQSLLPITVGQGMSFYLNTAPLSGHDATITSIGYQASADGDGLLTYKIRATFPDTQSVRIGWQGTAKIKSHWSIWGYSVLRRPLIALRNLMGI